VRLRIGERQSGTPGAAEQQPSPDAKMPTQCLDVVDQVRGGVGLQAAQWARSSGPALVENDGAPESGIEEPPVHRTRPGARAAMQEQHRHPARIAHLLPVHHMATRQRQIATLEGSDLREQVAARHPASIWTPRMVEQLHAQEGGGA